MIYSINDNAQMGPGGVFNDNFTSDLENPLEWKNYLPEMGRFSESAFVDTNMSDFFDLAQKAPEIRAQILAAPTIQKGLELVYGEALLPSGYLAQLGGRNVVSAIRGVVGNVAISVGILRRSKGNLKKIFDDALVTVANSIDMLSNIVNSDFFQKAVEGISYWPIVGWIIAAVADTLKMVVQLADYYAEKRLTKVTRELAKRFYLPLYNFGQVGEVAETVYMQNLLVAIQSGALDLIFRPAYGAYGSRSAEDIEAYPASDSYQDDGQTYDLADAFYLYLKGRVGSGGMGFLPGTSRLIMLDELRTGSCGPGNIRNTGDYFVSLRTTASFVWNLALNDGNPFSCSIDTRGMEDAWADSVFSSMVFAAESISKGWSCDSAPGPNGPIAIGTPDQDKGICHPRRPGAITSSTRSKELTQGICSKRGWKPRYGDKVDRAPGVSHFEEYVYYLERMYWGRGPEQEDFPLPVRDNGKAWDPDTYHFQNMSSSMAIQNMRDRQVAFLEGPDAFYVHPFSAKTSVYPDIVPFAALSDPDMRQRWERNLTDFLQVDNIWQNVVLQDVPKMVIIDGDAAINPIYKILQERGLSQNPKIGAVGGRIGVDPGYDVKPPEPPEQAGKSLGLISAAAIDSPPPVPSDTSWSTTKKIVAGVAAGAAVGAGAMAYRRWGRGFLDFGALRRR